MDDAAILIRRKKSESATNSRNAKVLSFGDVVFYRPTVKVI